MPTLHCTVCGGSLGEPIYTSDGNESLTSLCRTLDTETRVYACVSCSHLQTTALKDVDGYYATEYDILVDSDEEDQIYEMRAGSTVYRTEHQVRVMLDKLAFATEPLTLLDFGCAKSSTIRALCEMRPDVVPHAFDVSERYVPFWEKFIRPGNWAVDRIAPEWHERFDLVTSFFSLEHIPDVTDTVAEIVRVLKPGGIFYCIVPNVFGNHADFIVIDHCNHFTPPSLRHLLEHAGLRIREIDADSHRGAFVIVADKLDEQDSDSHGLPAGEVQSTLRALESVAAYWRSAASTIRGFEAGLAAGEEVAIYGAGFYGAFISAHLSDRGRVACHLDQNRFLSNKKFNGRPILLPDKLPDDVRTVLVGLNPAHAKSIIADIPALSGKALTYFYL